MSAGPAVRVTGADSPVSVDMSTSRVPVIRRASAQTLSPSSTSRTSPGTSSRAWISWRVPSRSTRACSGRNAARASTALSACISCANAKPAFSRITAAIAIASRGVPLAQASTAANASRTASGWVNCAASSPGQRRPPRRVSSFGPCTSSRRAASRPDRPAGDGPQVPKQLGHRLERVGSPVKNAGTGDGTPRGAAGARSSRPVPVMGGFRSRHESSIWPVHAVLLVGSYTGPRSMQRSFTAAPGPARCRAL